MTDGVKCLECGRVHGTEENRADAMTHAIAKAAAGGNLFATEAVDAKTGEKVWILAIATSENTALSMAVLISEEDKGRYRPEDAVPADTRAALDANGNVETYHVQ